jgi:uncharacterized protein YqhQ
LSFLLVPVFIPFGYYVRVLRGSIAAGIVVSILKVVPFVGFILALSVNFYAAVLDFRLHGDGFEDVTELETEQREDVGTAVA